MAFPTEYTEEVRKQLRQPVPKNEIKVMSRGARGGGDIRYTTSEFVERRLDEVVGDMNWQDDYTVTETTVVCRLKVFGVMKSAVADLNDKSNYGGPGERGQAKAFKRAAKKFGIAAELWAKDEAAPMDDDDDTPRRTKAGSGSGKYTKAVTLSAKQQAVLKERGFTDEEIARNTSYKIIDALFALDLPRGKKLSAVAREKFLEENGALPTSTVDDDDDDYEDEDDDE